jgi:hypothetical protein
MKNLTLFLGDSDIDASTKKMLENWITNNPDITLEYKSIHTNPTVVVRLGITDLPALVLKEAIIAQGSPESWIQTLLDRVFTYDDAYA